MSAPTWVQVAPTPVEDPHVARIWNQCRRLGRPPPRDVFHPKRGRRTNRNGPQPPHRLCPPQLGSRCSHSSQRPSRDPRLYQCRRLLGPHRETCSIRREGDGRTGLVLSRLTVYVPPNLGPGAPTPVKDPHVTRVWNQCRRLDGPHCETCSIRREGDGPTGLVLSRLTVYVPPNLGPVPPTPVKDPHVTRVCTISRRLGGPHCETCSIRREGDAVTESVPSRLTVYVPPNLGPGPPTSRRPSRGPHWYQCRRLGEPPQRDVFHPKRGRRCNRTGPQPPHRLCPPQLGSAHSLTNNGIFC